jgi:hypothetical protein
LKLQKYFREILHSPNHLQIRQEEISGLTPLRNYLEIDSKDISVWMADWVRLQTSL